MYLIKEKDLRGKQLNIYIKFGAKIKNGAQIK